MKKVLVLASFLISIPVQAFEDCILYTDAKISDISILHNDVIDVCPISTIMNKKNTLLVQPLKVGSTYFSVLKNGKEKVIFHVDVDENFTTISDADGFSHFKLDTFIPNNLEYSGNNQQTNELGFPVSDFEDYSNSNDDEFSDFIDLPPEVLGGQ